ncbi:MAG TPA: hypothetical protein VHY18_03720 [Solirubrobacteraceae bacterium]|jgi:hypothetical protein|nr:hypothetical protein [Solirubrobacteraceae bacterium]
MRSDTIKRAHPVELTAGQKAKLLGWAQWLWWLPVALAVVYVAIMIPQYGQLAAAINISGDSASALMIGQLFGHGSVTLGNMAWYSVLLFEVSTRWLPAHRQIWEAAPWAMILGAAGLIGWATGRLASRWAGAMSAVLVICAGPGALIWLLPLNAHGETWFSLALLAAWLVALSTCDIGRGKAVAGIVVVGLVCGANGISDDTLIICGWLPFVLVGGLVAAYEPRDRRNLILTRMAGTAFVCLLAAVALRLLMDGLNVHREAVDVTSFIGEGSLGTTFRWLIQGTAMLGDGSFYGKQLGLTSGLELVCAAMTLVGFCAVLRMAWTSAFWRAPPAGATPRTASGWRVYIAFWGSSALLVALSYLVNSQTEPGNLAFNRYLVGGIYAIAAVLPLLAARGPAWRGLVFAGVLVFALTGVMTRAQRTLLNPQEMVTSPTDVIANQVLSQAKRLHLKTGYAGYWDAAPITVAAQFGVDVYPVFTCGTTICPNHEHVISTWYTPRPERSFLIVDPLEAFVQSAPVGLGKPSAVIPLTVVTMYVYPYDIASRLSKGECPAGC